MAKHRSALEQSHEYEAEHLTEIAQSVGVALARELQDAAAQGTLFPGGTLVDKLRIDLANENPKSLIVDAREFENYRYNAAVLASGVDDEQISTARGSRMWDMVLDCTRIGTIERGGGTYDLFSESFVVDHDTAATVFARDYTQIAEERMAGFDLLYKAEGDI